jgi:ribosomal protein S18 acetylase RimI-like enzyme
VDPIRCEPLKRNDTRQLVHLIARTFTADEPLCVALGLLAPDIERFLQAASEQLLSDGLTMVARDVESGKLAGALIAEDLASPLPVEPENLSPKFQSIISLLTRLSDEYRQGTTLSSGQHLHALMLATDRRYRGRGMAQKLIAASIENGLELGFRRAVTEATGVVAQHVFRKAGFVERLRVPYATFRRDSATPFASIQGHEGAILMEKSLDG